MTLTLKKPADRRRLRKRLTEGGIPERQREARRAVPAVTAALERIRSDMTLVKARFKALCEGTNDSPELSPVVQHKAKVYRILGPVILAVEVALAAYTAALTISGGVLLHVVAGLMATALFTGLAKIVVTSLVNGGRMRESTVKLERQLRWLAIATVFLLGGFFIARFFPGAEIVFGAVSTLLSFSVAGIVALCHTLGNLLLAHGREFSEYRRLALLEAELADLLKFAEEVATDQAETAAKSGATPCGDCGRLSFVMSLLLALMVPVQTRAAEQLAIWVDVSGSLVETEFHRVREVLKDPLPLLQAINAQEVAVAPFWSEEDALMGMAVNSRLPVTKAAPDCEGTSTVFTATRRAREQDCAAAAADAEETWQGAVNEMLVPYRDALDALDVTENHRQTCLYPLLSRIASSGSRVFQVVITDGGHTGCGPAPQHPVDGDRGVGLVVLVPDNGGSGVAARMAERTATLKRLYPGLTVVPSWKIQAGMSWSTLTGQDEGR